MTVSVNWRQFDRIALAVVAASWIWKVVEYAGRATRLLDRNLGWGFYVNFTIPVVATIVLLSLLALRKIARLLTR
jgi:hypothetical protein